MVISTRLFEPSVTHFSSLSCKYKFFLLGFSAATTWSQMPKEKEFKSRDREWKVNVLGLYVVLLYLEEF